jgi:hypothetical protein
VFNKLPDLFDRNFVVGYALPAALFFGASLLLLTGLGLQNIVTPYATFDTLLGTTLTVLVGLLIAVLLLVVNRDLYRVLEGYGWGTIKVFQSLTKQQQSRFSTLDEEVKNLKIERKAKGKAFPAERADELRTKQAKLVLHFPHKAEFILPTAFGNTIRAFEVYPTVMYGVDSIHGWNRLLAVVPKDYLALVDTAKAATDFWVNLIYLGLLFTAESIGLLLYTREWGLAWVPVVTVIVVVISYTRARSAAVGWGDLLKAAFDVFLPELARKLEFDQPTSKEGMQHMWGNFSKAIVFRAPASLPARIVTSSVPMSSTDSTTNDSVFSLPPANQISDEEFTRKPSVYDNKSGEAFPNPSLLDSDESSQQPR